MSLQYGLKAIHQSAAANRPHILGFATPRGASGELFEVWNDDTGTDKRLAMAVHQTVLAGNFLPKTTAAHDLGAAGTRWRDGWFGRDVEVARFLRGGMLVTDRAAFSEPGGATYHNYDVGDKSVLRIGSSGGGDVSFSGWDKGARANEQVRFLINAVATASIILKHDDAGSLAANRFQCPGSSDLIVPPFGGVTVIYEDGIDRWRPLAGATSA